jgi:hypothetical protein
LNVEPSIDEWLSSIGGLMEGGRQILEKATGVSLIAVKYLNVEDIRETKLSIGDRGIFRAASEALQVPSDLPKPQPPEVSDMDEGILYSIKERSSFFSGLQV